MDHNQEFAVNRNIKGHVKIYEYDPVSGCEKLLVDQPNKITSQGAGILASALGGLNNKPINYMYVQWADTNASVTAEITDTVANFTNFAAVPLAFSPSVTTLNSVSCATYFTAYLLSNSGVANGKYIPSLGLINRTADVDILFSRTAFTPFQYNNSTSLAITWGITFTVS